MWIPSGTVAEYATATLQRRDETPSAAHNGGGMSSGARTGIIVAVVLIALVFLSFVVFFMFRWRRTKANVRTDQAGTRWKTSLRSFWPGKKFSKKTTQVSETSQTSSLQPLQPSNRNATDSAAGVDRNTSVRSVMTLPAYSPDARPTEKVIAREGERGGIDTVVEFPEGDDEVEARRNEEMESLYQIRRARREERAVRTERRRLRQEAQQRGDSAALEELRQQSISRRRDNNEPSAAQLLLEHNNRERERRFAAVDYAMVGLARHDGSRLRANSNDSDRPLLSRHGSNARSIGTHFANQSTTSLRYMADISDDDEPQARDGSSEFDAASSPQDQRDDPLANMQTDSADPPDYEHLGLRGEFGEIPPYQSPVNATAPALPGAPTLPSIEITPFTPVVGPEHEDTQREEELRRLT